MSYAPATFHQACKAHHGQRVPVARERLMLWMIVNCLAISRGCERDKSTIKFDRLPPSIHPTPLSPAASPVTSLDHSNFPVSFSQCPSSFRSLRLHSPSSHFPLLLRKPEFKGDGTELSCPWRPPRLSPTLGEDFREISPYLQPIYSMGGQYCTEWNDFHVLTWLSLGPAGVDRVPRAALHKAMTPQPFEQ